MQIVNVRPFDGPMSARGFRCVAKFAVDVTADFRVFDWQLIETPSGTHQAYAPAGKSTPQIIAMSPDARRDIARRAAEILKRETNDHTRH
ncbi:hypothetical protein [uncultured Nitratireductor sp.]|uniref:hypothetical protein n=1 Tax=uncultured Nitratireductor sp. TaxID=520953 RepID=UPI0026164A9A|nr:hypothetical protein [uncultured Nitratireductor sp.]